MPAVYAAAFLAGLVDTAFFTFLPIWGLRMNLDPAFALALLSVFVAGNIALQLPVGLLADRIGTRPVMALCGLISVISPIGAVYAAGIPILLCAILFVWGGAIWALYTLAMIDIGHRCRGTTLAAASGALVVVYTISNVSGCPPLTGARNASLGIRTASMAVSSVIAAVPSCFILALRPPIERVLPRRGTLSSLPSPRSCPSSGAARSANRTGRASGAGSGPGASDWQSRQRETLEQADDEFAFPSGSREAQRHLVPEVGRPRHAVPQYPTASSRPPARRPMCGSSSWL